jgi:hypothetical protein
VTSDHTLKLCEEKNPTEIHNALHEVCGNRVVDRDTVSLWASRFREGQVSIQDDRKSGRPVTATDDTSVVIVSTLLKEDRRKSREEIAHDPLFTVTAAYYRKFLQAVLRPKIRQQRTPCSHSVSSFCTINRGLMPQVQYRKFWKIMDGKFFPT